MQQIYFTIKDICETLKVDRSTIYRQVKAGKFPPPIKIGKLARWEQSTLEQFLKNQQGGQA